MLLESWTGTRRSTPPWSEPTNTPRAPGKGELADPGKTPASAGTVTRWADHQAAHIADGRGRNLVTRLTPGQDAETLRLVALVDAVRVARPGGRSRPRKRLDHLTGDKASSSRANRTALRARRLPHTIPERDDQKANRVRKGARGGRPPKFDRVRSKQRNQVERLMNRRKQFRAVATRYDKLACRYQATVTIADIFIWLRARPDQPRRDPRHAL
jgi:transposase